MIAIWVTLGMSVASVFVEYICIARVYKMVPALRRTPESTVPAAMEDAIELNAPGTPPPQPKLGIAATAWLRSTANRLLPVKFIPFYFKHQAFLPSISLSLLYLTVLSFSGQMVTFLLASGYNSIHVGIARTVSTIFELSATWIAPRIMRYIGAIRGGMWFLSWQMAWLAVDLDNRGAFSTVEASFQNLFELLSYVSTIVFSRPNQFQWPAVISAAAVYLAGAITAT
ncbi:putative iron-regulated protein [Neofusicoccum parvum UCRNP2]|uniref:Solute carrier family 40 member n=1 Tax=Botryosphaeria parva (strain UCR-NP2) TaxID=1287680 RepID=R1GW81_BOTPV|nr:putative iron-regulated protein [Neofusicoccum parvum UCRNP2]